ncbi:MAG: 23S rRNA (pseudouridine(1915)-N(3))-methyltransferase RlmH [Candidatus Nanosyncoccus sp.]
MIHIIAGGKKHLDWVNIAVSEYQKRLKKPFNIEWELIEEEKLNQYLAKWPFSGQQYVILLDERGKNLSSPELSGILSQQFVNSREVVIIIGGAFGVSEEIRQKSNLVWSLSRLVFPHQLVRAILAEQVYRAQEIWNGGKYHHM